MTPKYLLLPIISLYIIVFYFSIDSEFKRFVFLISTEIVVILIALLNSKNIEKSMKWFALYLLIIMVSELIARYLSYTVGNNHIVFHVMIPVQILFFMSFYYHNLRKSISPKYFYLLLCIVLIISLILSLRDGAIKSFPSMQFVILGTTIILLSLLQFKEMILFPITQKIEKQPLFWFNLGNLIFFSISYFFLGVLGSLSKVPQWAYIILWSFNIVLYVCYFLFVTFSINQKHKIIS